MSCTKVVRIWHLSWGESRFAEYSMYKWDAQSLTILELFRMSRFSFQQLMCFHVSSCWVSAQQPRALLVTDTRLQLLLMQLQDVIICINNDKTLFTCLRGTSQYWVHIYIDDLINNSLLKLYSRTSPLNVLLIILPILSFYDLSLFRQLSCLRVKKISNCNVHTLLHKIMIVKQPDYRFEKYVIMYNVHFK